MRSIGPLGWGLGFALAGYLGAANPTWPSGSAYLLPQGHWEVGLFQPLRYGYSNTLEWSTHPLLNLKIPNFRVTVAHDSWRGWARANRYSAYYPTPLMRWLQSPLKTILGDEDLGALIPPEHTIPPLLAVHFDALISKLRPEGILVTNKAGVGIGIGSGPLDSRTSIDLPLVYPRLSLFYNRVLLRLGTDLSGVLTGHWRYLLDYDLFLMPGGEGRYAFEHKGLLVWYKSSRFQVTLGYKLTAGEYPFGVQAQLFPLLDFQWSGQR